MHVLKPVPFKLPRYQLLILGRRYGVHRGLRLAARSDCGRLQLLDPASQLCQKRPRTVPKRNSLRPQSAAPDKQPVKQNNHGLRRRQPMNVPWAMQMKAVSTEEPSRLVQSLTGAILGCGGWVLSRGANNSGKVNMLFEFERLACIEIYTVLIASGLELSQTGHIRLTELCQCTRSQQRDCGTEIASVDLEIQTFSPEFVEDAPMLWPA
jgi:hypothetical protein